MADLKKIPPLDWQTPMVDPETGRPSAQFLRLWQEMFQNGDILNDGKVDSDLMITTTAPINGGGDLTEDRVIGHDESGVVPGVYTSPEVTVDEFGHITDIVDGVGGGIELEEGGVAVTGGPFTTLNFNTGATVVDAGSGVVDIDIAGGGGLSSYVGVKAYNNGTQSVANSTTVAAQFNAEEWDTSSFHDPVTNNTRFYAPTTGRYEITYHIRWDTSAAGVRYTWLRSNGTTFIIGSRSIVTPNSGDLGYGMTTEVTLNAGDYIEALLFQTSGGTRTTGELLATDAGSVNSLSMRYIG